MADADSSLYVAKVAALMPTPAGCATFLQCEDSPDPGKACVIFIDSAVGAFINLVLSGQKMPRPMTHQLMGSLMQGMGIKLRGACIVGQEEEVYFCRMVFEMNNEISEMKVLEVDARPGDALALSLLEGCPFSVKASLWHSMEDVSSKLLEIRNDMPENGSPDFFG